MQRCMAHPMCIHLVQVLCSATMNSFAFAGLSDAASVADSLAVASAAGLLPESFGAFKSWQYASDAALFRNASSALRVALISTLWNETVGAFNAAVLGDADAMAQGGLHAFPPSYYGTMLAVAKGVLDDDPQRLKEALAFLIDPLNSPVTAALDPMPAIYQVCTYAYG